MTELRGGQSVALAGLPPAPPAPAGSAAGALSARFARAGRDRIGALIAAACEYGVRFRISGADLIVDGARHLAPEDRDLLGVHIDAVRERLMPNPPGGDLLEQLGVPLELITDEATAREGIASPAGDGRLRPRDRAPARARAAAGMARDHQGRPVGHAPADPQGQDRARPAPRPAAAGADLRSEAPGWCTWSTSAPCRSRRSRVCGRAGW